MDTNKELSIVPLNDKNYSTWKVQMKMLLMRENLFGILDGTEAAPPADATDSHAGQKYKRRHDRALATIVLSIDPSLLYLLGDPTDPAVAWTTLQNTFTKKTWSNRLRLKRKLYNLKLKTNGSLQ